MNLTRRLPRPRPVARAAAPTLALSLALTAVGAVFPGGVLAQEEARPTLSGQVLVGDDQRPVPGVTVVLHKVDATAAGEVDSVRTGADGDFRFDLPTVPDPANRGDVYFASTTWDGVFYFGPPLTNAVQLDSAYAIQVYDTAVVAMGETGAQMAVRYLLAEEDEAGWLVTDLMELVIPGDRTFVSLDSSAVWVYPLPEEARAVEVGGGDAEGTTAALVDGTLQLGGPMAPGPRQVLVRYRLDSLALTVPVPGGAAEMEFLVREPAPELVVEGLVATGVMEGEPGVDYRRFAARDVPSTVVRIAPGDAPFVFSQRWVAVLLGLIFAAAGVWAMRRGSGAPAAAGAAGGVAPGGVPVGDRAGTGRSTPSRDELVREVAALDLQLADTQDPGEREELQRVREGLLRRIRETS
jgi:hypothetical protein